MQFHQNTPEQETLPASAIMFRRYLATYQLEPLDVALKSGVQYMTVWRIWQGQPIGRQFELLVRQGLLHLTGIPILPRYSLPVNWNASPGR